MDNGNEIRHFLVFRRAKITPEQAGLQTTVGVPKDRIACF